MIQTISHHPKYQWVSFYCATCGVHVEFYADTYIQLYLERGCLGCKQSYCDSELKDRILSALRVGGLQAIFEIVPVSDMYIPESEENSEAV